MTYASMRECVEDLEANGHLVRIKEEVDPYLEMAEIHRRVYAAGGPALFFEKVKGSPFPAVSNLFGTLERSRFIFRHTLDRVSRLVAAKSDPASLLKHPLKNLMLPVAAACALPKKVKEAPVMACTTDLSSLPQITCWPDDGGPFVLLPQVYSEDPKKPGILVSNMGMYRIQMAGNDYVKDREVGLHYQIKRDIGRHHAHAIEKGEPLKVSVFVGGPPAHTFAAVMPLPENLPEVAFAGALAGRRFRYAKKGGHTLSAEADFCIIGTVDPTAVKPEGPFGDHIGYYSLTHPFPFLNVEKIYHRKDAIWPFTVVGRPPAEDTSFGALIHELTGPAVPDSIPGVSAVHAVDAAGVHPLLLAIGKETYVPYAKGDAKKPMELLTLSNAILGFGQCSLAKYLFIVDEGDNPHLDIHDERAFLIHLFERMDFTRDLHFQTRATMDTLDYSAEGLNEGSKVVFAAAGDKKRNLATTLPRDFSLPDGFATPRLALPGVVMVEAPPFTDAAQGNATAQTLADHLSQVDTTGLALIVLTEDAGFASATLNNFLWTTFTRSNPSHDIHGVGATLTHKHWGCIGPLIIDARLKPHHAPPLIEDPEVSKRVDALCQKGGPLDGIL
ncbi:UbiD family decarboxylase [Desulfoluna spongiiphila]|uniref:4-hydroxy-3-polyprenylbenzoate decarboxylase n=1 Tax=Desulfoluna spongiiphila TaxID=419481 RepID=A0A1G5I3L9_9BACT|nr:UbiD family decarboxylase [Desulfoluna spongiiphila]SCY70715.1 4-hydroxy-3-polyprenylbenzoate decarboxylase [Desulfoluna spongiiphila]